MTSFVRVERQRTEWVDRFRRYVIVIDEAPLGKIRQDETLTFSVPPGDHTIVVKIGRRWSSRARVWQSNDGGTATFVCRSSTLRELPARMFHPHGYIELDETV